MLYFWLRIQFLYSCWTDSFLFINNFVFLVVSFSRSLCACVCALKGQPYCYFYWRQRRPLTKKTEWKHKNIVKLKIISLSDIHYIIFIQKRKKKTGKNAGAEEEKRKTKYTYRIRIMISININNIILIEIVMSNEYILQKKEMIKSNSYQNKCLVCQQKHESTLLFSNRRCAFVFRYSMIESKFSMIFGATKPPKLLLWRL